MTGPPVLLAAGGTGGHRFPAEALARALAVRGVPAILATDARGDRFAVDGVTVARVRAGTLGGGLAGTARGALGLGLGLVDALRLIRRTRPAAVVGFGGYPSVPTVVAAAFSRVPVVVHEQNAVLGRANRLCARVAARVATSFPDTLGVAAGAARLTGNPVRPAIVAAAAGAYEPPAADGPVRLVVLGGSQGARVFSEIVPAALIALPAQLRSRIALAQQARPEDLERARVALGAAGLGQVEIASFFDDVPARLAAAHLVICRAGASTIAELAAVGRPAVLVPYPHARDDHQSANAAAVAAAGAATVIAEPDLTAAALADRLAALLGDPRGLSRGAAAAAAWVPGDAAARLAEVVCDLVGAAAGPDPTETEEAAA